MAQDKKEPDTNWPIPDKPSEAQELKNLESLSATHQSAELDPHIQDQLGRVFRNCCDDPIMQPICEKFVALLAKLEAKTREEK